MGEVRHVEKPATKMKERVEAPPPEKPKPSEWTKIGEAPELGTPAKVPFDGRSVVVSGTKDGKERVAEATWRTTRSWDQKTSTWEKKAFWSLTNSGGQPLDFEPTQWRTFALVLTEVQ